MITPPPIDVLYCNTHPAGSNYAWAGPLRPGDDSRGLRSKARSCSDGVEGRLMTDVASLGVQLYGGLWAPLFAWCVRSAHTAPFRTRSLRAALLTSRLPQLHPGGLLRVWKWPHRLSPVGRPRPSALRVSRWRCPVERGARVRHRERLWLERLWNGC